VPLSIALVLVAGCSERCAEHCQRLGQRATRNIEMLADAGHCSIPVARRNAAEAAALVGHDRELAVLGFSDDKRICSVSPSWVGNRAYTAPTLR
jgi:hypothetical protein